MTQPRVPTLQLQSNEFCICAGSLLFRHIPNKKRKTGPTADGFAPSTNSSVATDKKLEACILWHSDREEYLLPKGRKDRGESLEQTALRETYEETGYPCKLLPVDMVTRAPEPGVNTKDGVGLYVADCIEPFTITTRQIAERNMKYIFWFVSCVDEDQIEVEVDEEDPAAAPGAVPNGITKARTQLRPKWPRDDCGEVKRIEGTQMDSERFDSRWFPVEEALQRLTFTTDRELLARAVELVRNTYGQDDRPS
ncbi:hypothetical protein PUNSTDRAFT_123237 [Punctularia strigosozonata HHB-11173 SS5]|uniref:Nudix hydrolase domain-containing protein n=1 Tax=Punctularia strigosozonata (strain HHB-11173) TaxID=741275 RepID=R7RZJ6_PUNST|nr:uncharacterized protein PUNSTDRAFT_123237 [Punctularia strigosozonata HHB-11173 SS5]EIN03540.1 hypothetical protein PUNSTDRAFT_123237 [Punctularia strigosozonata HHB-11173 SS5]